MELDQSPQNVARQAELLPVPLSPMEQRVIRCAERILSRPNVTAFKPTEVRTCTGVTKSCFNHALKKVHEAGFLERQATPLAHSSAQGRVAYRPKVREEDGEQFFIPAPAPGCNRREQDDVLEALGPMQLRTLACLAHISCEPEAFPDTPRIHATVLACTGLLPASVSKIFASLCAAGWLEPAGTFKQPGWIPTIQYKLTALGKWVVEDMPIPQDCGQRCNPKIAALGTLPPREKKPGPSRKLPETEKQLRAQAASVLGWWVIHAVDERYRQPDRSALISRLMALQDSGVLEVTVAPTAPAENGLHDEKTGNRLWFASLAMEYTQPAGRLAIAHWAEIDTLLYGRRFPSEDVRHAAGVPPHIRFDDFVKAQYYDPLLRQLEAARHEDESC